MSGRMARIAALAALSIGRFSNPTRRCRSSVVEHPLGKGEVVSSILTGSTRHAPICALFVLAFFAVAQTERRTNMGKIRGLCSGGHSRLSGNRSLMFACLRMNLFRFASESAVDPGRKFNRCRQRRRRSCPQLETGLPLDPSSRWQISALSPVRAGCGPSGGHRSESGRWRR